MIPLRGAERNGERKGDCGGDQGGKDGALERAHDIKVEPTACYAVPQRAESIHPRWQQNRIHELIPPGQIPDGDEAEDADDRQVRIQTNRLHPLRTSRWKTSRQCALTRTKSCCESVASLRGRAAS